MTTMMQDYRIMNPHRGFLCLNEIEFGAPLPGLMSSIFRQKVPSPNTYRSIILEAKRFNALEALKEGLVDDLSGIDETLLFVNELKLPAKGKSGVYGRLKAEMWRETVGYLTMNNNIGGSGASSSSPSEDTARELKNLKVQEALEKKRIEDWERGGGRLLKSTSRSKDRLSKL